MMKHPTTGLKTITVRFTTDTGSSNSVTYTSQSHIWIQPTTTSPIVASRNGAVTERIPENPNQEIQLTATRPHLGTLGRATLQIGLSDDGIFDHPLIVVEGFDASRWLPIDDYNYRNFRFAIRNRELGDFLDRQLTEFRNYDVVFVNFADGTDHIQRNAYVVQEAIRWVNRNKVNNLATGQREPNVVLGMSMGGLVARYALAEMERPTDGRTSENHEVCQYYSPRCS
ncbi:MAG: esterase/lipase family protein [Thermoflexibacteraceae bacterium]